MPLLHIAPLRAACSTTGASTTCNTASPNPWTATVGSGPNTASGASVTLAAGAQISAGNANAISLGDNAVITLGNNSVVRNNATSGSGTSGNGLWNAGKNTIEFGSNGRLTIGTGASVQSLGTSNNAEAINVMGIGNVITNYGTITGTSGAAIWFEDRTTGGVNTIDNFGTIQTGLGANANVIGNQKNGDVDFINETGAVVNGSLSFAGGDDTLKLLPGSTITGGFNGGGGTNTLELDGAAGSSDTLPGTISNFQTLTKVGEGTWTLSGAVGNNGGNAALAIEVENGTLALTGDNTNFNGSVTVDAAGVLEARAQSLPPTVTDNGLVRFAQDTAGTYSGTITGAGGVEKTLGGTLTLSGGNTYTGGTTVNAGTVVISSDANLGGTSGGLTLNGGALGTATDVTLARTTTLGDLGGTFDVTAGTLTANGLVTGTGTLTKTGAGTLALTNSNDYTGDTIIDQGTVQIASNDNLGSLSSALEFNGGTLATTADITTARSAMLGDGGGTLQVAAGTTLTDSGVFSGTGTLTKTGDGTLKLTAVNTQTGGTAINGGTMIVTNDDQLGDPSAPLQFDGGTLVAGAGETPRPTILNAGGGTIELDGDPTDPSQYLTVSGAVSGTGGLTKTGTGTLVYSGDNSYTGPTTIEGGGFYVDGNSSAQTGIVTAQSGARLGGTGTLGGDVVIDNGATLAPGSAPLTPATLTINGNLTLNPTSNVFYNIIEADTEGGPLNDLTVVHGDLTLDGVFNILDQGQTLGPGVYRIFDYDGSLTNNGLTLGNYISQSGVTEGSLTAAGFSVQTSIPNQVNLINTTGLSLNYWDGGSSSAKNNKIVDGGDGVWQGDTGNDNWTNAGGTPNAVFTDSAFAIFSGTAGTVTVDAATHGAVNASGMQFEGGGYLIEGDPVNLVGSNAIIRVGDGTASGSAITATISSVLTGSATLDKTDLGTLILTADNTYSGGTAINGGVLQISKDTSLGSGDITLDTGTLATTADMATARTVTLDAGGGVFQPAASTTLELDGQVTGGGTLTQDGDGTLVLADNGNDYTGGTIVAAGTLQVGDGGTSGVLPGNATDNATLVFNRSDDIAFGGSVSGTGTLVKDGTGTLTLTGDSTYSGGTTISNGTLQIGDGNADGSIEGDVADNDMLVFNRSDEIDFAGVISGSGAITQSGGGDTLLSGANSYAGATTVSAGGLYVNGDQSAANGATTVESGATLGGTGTIGGDVAVEGSGQLAPGGNTSAPGTLAVKGGLTLNNSAVLNYSFGQANVVGGPFNDLANVQGNLTLGGTLNVVTPPGGSFDPGVYRIINYGGTLADNGLSLGTFPTGDTFFVQTAVDKQVNLINATGLTLNYWDGENGPPNNNAIDGGVGTWRVAASDNSWTDRNGAANAAWSNGAFAVFEASGGAVTVDDGTGGAEQVEAQGMQFAGDGYVLSGDAIELSGSPSLIRVGDGTSDGAAYTATINAVLSGGTMLEKDDLGTLVLTGANTYSGGTAIDGGVLEISADANLGASGTAVTFDQGTLATTADIATARPVTLNGGGGTFETVSSTTLELDGAIGGTGSLAKTGAGTLVLAGDGTYSGGTVIADGTLQIGNGGTTGSIAGDVVDNATLVFDRSDTIVFDGAVSGNGEIVQQGSGTTILTADSNFTGGTRVQAGTLQMGNGAAAGSVTGDIADNGQVVFNRSDEAEFAGVISGTGSVTQSGNGTTILTGTNSYTGGTTISSGTLQLGNGGVTGSITGNVVDNGTIAFDRADTVTFASAISGGGTLVQSGTGTTILTGTNSFTGGATILSGTLQVGDGGTNGTLLGNVVNNGTLIVDRSDNLTITAVMSGTGNAIKEGADTIILTGDSTYTGGTTIAQGTLQLGNGGVTGSILGDIVDNAALAFDRSDSELVNGVISGSGTLIQKGTGTTVLGADDTYTGGTTVSTGTLQIGNGGTAGSIMGDVTDNAILVFNHSDTFTYPGTVSGTGQLVQAGFGTLILTADNSYSGGTSVQTGTLQIASDANLGAAAGSLHIGGGTLAVTDDITMARLTVLEQLGGTFEVPDGITLTDNGSVRGAGGLTKTGGGLMILGGTNLYAGPTTVAAGTLFVNGDQTGAAGLTTVASGATLGGTGIVGGDAIVEDGGTLAPGDDPGTLTINGNLTLSPNSRLAYDFGAANVVGGPLNDQTAVGGDLVLDGTIDVTATPGGTFDPGIYRVITYAGSLTDNGLEIGTIPSPDFFVQTSVAHEVNLINTAGLTLNYWDGAAGPKNDGAIQGGDGVWQSSTGNDNWTDAGGTINAPFTDAAFAIFEGAGGTVTVDSTLGAIEVSGMQFASDGYVVEGDSIHLVGTPTAPDTTVIRVGDGADDGAHDVTEIDSMLAGNTALVKSDLGTLILTAANTYAGGTLIEGGTLQISSDGNLGAASGALTLDGGTLATTASFASARATTLNGLGGIFDTGDGTAFTLSAPVTGSGSLTKTGSGTLILMGESTYAGGTTISDGTLQLGDGGTTGSIVGDVTDNATLVFNRSDIITFGGTIGGSGNVAQTGSGTTVLTSDNGYTGGTTVSAGTLAIGDAAHASAALSGGGTVTVAGAGTFGGYGSVGGSVVNNGTLVVADALSAFGGQGRGDFAIAGTLTNAGTVKLGGAGAGNRLTVGSYVGQDGQIAMNVLLDGDGAPADQLLINGGTAGGHSVITVTSLGGMGAETPGNGILLVNALKGATTSSDAFSLGNRVVAGPYEYTLFRGARDNSAPDSWYLRSELINPPVPPPSPPSPPSPPAPLPPEYRPEVSLYTALPSMALNYGTTLIGDLHKRVGEEDRETNDGETVGFGGAWARFIGSDGHWDAQTGGIYRKGPAFDDGVEAVQGGMDLYRSRRNGESDFAGLLASYGHVAGSVENYDGAAAGSDRFDAYSVGGYWTHFGRTGWYLDGVVQGTWYHARAVSDYGTGLDTDGRGVTLSAEGGYPVALEDGWSLEPQVQLIYQALDFDDASDVAAQVRFRDVESLAERVGFRGARTWILDDGRPFTAWLSANVWNEFKSDAKTEFSSDDGFVPFQSDLRGVSGEAGAGADAEIADHISVYATLGYQMGLGGGIRAFGGSIGLRFDP